MRKRYGRPTADMVVCAAQDILMTSDGNSSIGGGVELPPISARVRDDLPVIDLRDEDAGGEL